MPRKTRILTQEHKDRISASLKGNPKFIDSLKARDCRPHKAMSEETKAKISASLLKGEAPSRRAYVPRPGVAPFGSPEHKAKMSTAMSRTRRPMSDETKAKIAEALTRKCLKG